MQKNSRYSIINFQCHQHWKQMFLFNLSVLKVITPAFFHRTQQILTSLWNDTKIKTPSFMKIPRKLKRENLAFFCASQWAPQTALGDVFWVGSTPFRKPACKDGKYTWIMFEHLTGFLQLLVQYCLWRLTVVPCYWKAKKRSLVRYGCISFTLEIWNSGRALGAEDKNFVLFFFLAMAANNNTIFDCLCVEAVKIHVEVAQCHHNSWPVMKKLTVQFFLFRYFCHNSVYTSW